MAIKKKAEKVIEAVQPSPEEQEASEVEVNALHPLPKSWCGACEGKGLKNAEELCSTCNGSGQA